MTSGKFNRGKRYCQAVCHLDDQGLEEITIFYGGDIRPLGERGHFHCELCMLCG